MLTLEYPDPKSYTEDGKEIQDRKIGICARAAQQTKREEEMRREMAREAGCLNTGSFDWMSR